MEKEIYTFENITPTILYYNNCITVLYTNYLAVKITS